MREEGGYMDMMMQSIAWMLVVTVSVVAVALVALFVCLVAASLKSKRGTRKSVIDEETYQPPIPYL